MSAALEISRMPAKKGRPAKDGPRTPSGQLSRARSAHSEWQSMTAHAQRIRDAVMSDAKARAEFEWALGKLFLWGRLAAPAEPHAKDANARRYAAGKLFLETVQRADVALGCPPRTPQGQDISSVRGQPGEGDAERDRKALSRYYAAEGALGMSSAASRVVASVVIQGAAPVGHEELLALREGLQRLADHFKVTR